MGVVKNRLQIEALFLQGHSEKGTSNLQEGPHWQLYRLIAFSAVTCPPRNCEFKTKTMEGGRVPSLQSSQRAFPKEPGHPNNGTGQITASLHELALNGGYH